MQLLVLLILLGIIQAYPRRIFYLILALIGMFFIYKNTIFYDLPSDLALLISMGILFFICGVIVYGFYVLVKDILKDD